MLVALSLCKTGVSIHVSFSHVIQLKNYFLSFVYLLKAIQKLLVTFCKGHEQTTTNFFNPINFYHDK